MGQLGCFVGERGLSSQALPYPIVSCSCTSIYVFILNGNTEKRAETLSSASLGDSLFWVHSGVVCCALPGTSLSPNQEPFWISRLRARIDMELSGGSPGIWNIEGETFRSLLCRVGKRTSVVSLGETNLLRVRRSAGGSFVPSLV